MKFVLLLSLLLSSGSAIACDRFVNVHDHGEVAVVKGDRISITQDGKTEEFQIVQTDDVAGKPGPMYDAFSWPRVEDDATFRVYRNDPNWVIDEDAYAPACNT